MKRFTSTLLLSKLALCISVASAKENAALSTESYTKQEFSDAFSSSTLSKDWKLYKSASHVRDGVLVGIEEKDGGHAAVHGVQLKPFGDVELNLDLKFAGSKATNLTFNEQGFKDSHAGHICRVIVTPTKVTLREGKTGNFKNEIYEMKKAGKLDDATRALLKTKEASFPVKLKPDAWYAISIRIQGDLMQTFIDGKLVGSLRSEGIAHATKNKIGLVTPGQEMHYDNVLVKTP
jgi:hypothetical protein